MPKIRSKPIANSPQIRIRLIRFRLSSLVETIAKTIMAAMAAAIRIWSRRNMLMPHVPCG